ncbi:putative phosphothreonine lyase domain-containg protein [Nocardiopsis sp. MG754419]|uniref:putative phosphothreonine lyase domain-containing protein n=1 Tax=Nocardiopsis sp. MG754419 TaxID=2259865 RepID=UPI001BAE0E23|nr:putative phosphothreonine lyase domain-containg protein [Nocardiopsis sp. MG754419]MBR8743703.1 hypothetical protein [Nocardiopsis sp. MG754419]
MHTWRHAVNLAASETERKEVAALVNAGFTGKWMPFIATGHITQVWADLVEATEAGRLGWKATVATDPAAGKDVAVWVHTKDWRDQDDLARVLVELRALGIDQRLSYQEETAARPLLQGKGPSLYVAGPGKDDFTQRREACVAQGRHIHARSSGPEAERTVAELFARSEPYGPFPT